MPKTSRGGGVPRFVRPSAASGSPPTFGCIRLNPPRFVCDGPKHHKGIVLIIFYFIVDFMAFNQKFSRCRASPMSLCEKIVQTFELRTLKFGLYNHLKIYIYTINIVYSFVPTAITQSFFELQTPDFAWKFIWTVPTNFVIM